MPFENQRTKMECSCRRKLGTFRNCKKKNKNNENIYNTSNKTAQRILYIYINLELEPCLNQEQDEALFKKRAF